MAAHKILIIDDSDSIRTTLKLTLEFGGYEVDEAADGLEGLDRIRDGAYDLVLCDLAMPGLAGIDVIRKVRTEPQTASLPIVVLSAEERKMKDRALTAGANDCIDKPFAPQQVFDVVEKLLGGKSAI
ncbi:MAG TPA: response regulator [Sumerlaeia bacterium]|nr:response regulator [Sumerlaeia bacterium]